MTGMKYLVGIDEVGRGPLAGPVAVGAVFVAADFDWEVLPGVNDSKKLSEKNREAIFLRAEELKKAGQLNFVVSMVAAEVIDKKGIVPAINLAMERSLKKLEFTIPFKWNSEDGGDWKTEEVLVKLDGSLKAPARFVNQETIIKGDSKEKVIGLASIVAKVTRDRYMVQKSAEQIFAPYDFASHKGYGTKAHCEVIKVEGLSALHRHTFCHRLLSND